MTLPLKHVQTFMTFKGLFSRPCSWSVSLAVSSSTLWTYEYANSYIFSWLAYSCLHLGIRPNCQFKVCFYLELCTTSVKLYIFNTVIEANNEYFGNNWVKWWMGGCTILAVQCYGSEVFWTKNGIILTWIKTFQTIVCWNVLYYRTCSLMMYNNSSSLHRQ